MVGSTGIGLYLLLCTNSAHLSPGLLETARAKYDQLFSSIVTITLRNERTSTINGQPDEKSQLQYVQDGKDVAKSEVYSFSNREGISKGFRHQSRMAILNNSGVFVTDDEDTINGKPMPRVTYQLADAIEDNQATLWSQLHHRVGIGEHTFLNDFFSDKFGDKCTAREEILDNRPLVRLDIRGKNDVNDSGIVVWLDPAVGYWPRKIIMYSPESKSTAADPLSTYEVLQFHPPYGKTGISFPASIVATYHSRWSSKPYLHVQRIQYFDVRINDPIPAEKFKVAIPPNAWIVDNIKNINYHTDSAGKPIGPNQPNLEFKPTSTPSTPPRSWWREIAIGIIVLCLIAGFLYWRRSRLLQPG
ncbi:MAG: hypothetical protein ACRCZF_15535 [Gemmataceae bacterium]